MRKGMICAIILMMVFLMGCQAESTTDYSQIGVVREIPRSISAGEIFTVTLHINVGEGNTYYLIEETIPEIFEIVEGEHDSKNKIKLVELLEPKTTVFVYKLRAPEPGQYQISGEYAMDMENPAFILGDTTITVR